MGIKLKIVNTEALKGTVGVDMTDENENIINLTEHTVLEYHKYLEDMGKDDEYLSGKVSGVDIVGTVDVYDRSGEILDMKKISSWSKVFAHEKEAYRDILIEICDSKNEMYDLVHVEKAFIVTYKEVFEGKNGVGEFHIFIRGLDKLEEIIKE